MARPSVQTQHHPKPERACKVCIKHKQSETIWECKKRIIMEL